MRALPASALLSSMLAAGVACSPPAPAFELGTGDLEFEPLSDGDEILVIHGPQGGYHLLASLRAVDIEAGSHLDLGDPSNPSFEIDVVTHAGTPLVVNGLFTQGMVPTSGSDSEWSHETLGRFAILDIEDDSELVGEEVVFSAWIRPVTGPDYSDMISLVVQPHPLN